MSATKKKQPKKRRLATFGAADQHRVRVITENLLTMIRGHSDRRLERMRDYLRQVSQTNCAWYVYRAAPGLLALIENELAYRAHVLNLVNGARTPGPTTTGEQE